VGIIPVRLTVRPSQDATGRKAYSSRGQLFDAAVGDRVLLTRSITPFCDAARTLLADGIDPETKIVMYYDENLFASLQSTVGIAAKLTVTESRGKPAFSKWRPYVHAVSPPMRQNEVAATPIAEVDKSSPRASP